MYMEALNSELSQIWNIEKVETHIYLFNVPGMKSRISYALLNKNLWELLATLAYIVWKLDY